MEEPRTMKKNNLVGDQTNVLSTMFKGDQSDFSSSNSSPLYGDIAKLLWLTKLLPSRVLGNTRAFIPLRKTFPAVLCSSFRANMPCGSDKTATAAASTPATARFAVTSWIPLCPLPRFFWDRLQRWLSASVTMLRGRSLYWQLPLFASLQTHCVFF